MTTLFDIGDKIKLTLTGTVRSISIAENNDDCYVIDLYTPTDAQITRVYLDSKALLAGNAKKVGD